MKSLTVFALLSVASAATVTSAGPPDLCVWNEDAQSAVAGCAGNRIQCGEGVGCCDHWHVALNWKRCTTDGDRLKGPVTLEYYSAQYGTCDVIGEQDVCVYSGVDPQCERFERNCATVPCE